MVTVLMMSAKVGTLGLPKIKVISSKLLSMTSPTKFYHVTNYTVDVIMWPGFGNSSISMRGANIISILLGFDQKNHRF